MASDHPKTFPDLVPKEPKTPRPRVSRPREASPRIPGAILPTFLISRPLAHKTHEDSEEVVA
jgi:hypothetical protein